MYVVSGSRCVNNEPSLPYADGVQFRHGVEAALGKPDIETPDEVSEPARASWCCARTLRLGEDNNSRATPPTTEDPKLARGEMART